MDEADRRRERDREAVTMVGAAVSVIVPTHNAAHFLADALQSLGDQTLGEFECLIVDDASDDESPSIAQRFVDEDPRFELITLPERQGTSICRNIGIERSNGRWIGLLDADDLFVADRLEVLTGIGDSEAADMVFDDQWITEYPSGVSRHRAFGLTGQQLFTQEDFFSRSRLFRRAFPAGYMKPLIRRSFLELTQAAYDPSVPSGEDFLFYADLFAARPRCIATSYTGYIYRRRRGSLSRSDEHLHLHADLDDRIVRKWGSRLSPVSRAALEGRRRDFEDVAQAMPAIAALRHCNLGRLTHLLVTRPRLAVTCARLMLTRVLRTWPATRPRPAERPGGSPER